MIIKSNVSSQEWNKFTTDWEIHQVDNSGNNVKSIKLIDCWPTIVGPIFYGFKLHRYFSGIHSNS